MDNGLDFGGESATPATDGGVYNARDPFTIFPSDARFIEEFIEIMVRGEVEMAEDGSIAVIRPPVRKMFLIYTAI